MQSRKPAIAMAIRRIARCEYAGTGMRDVGRVLIPRLDETIEKRIAELVKKSLFIRIESEKLLDQAKTRVEQLIEEAVRS